MRRVILVAAVLSLGFLAVVLATTANAQMTGTPSGGLSAMPVNERTTFAPVTNESFFSQFVMKFRGWGTSVAARPAYRSPALVLRERVGTIKPR